LKVSTCAETALINKNINGCLETALELVKGGIEVALMLKYREEMIDTSSLRELKSIYETVERTLIGDKKQLFKFIHNTLIPLS